MKKKKRLRTLEMEEFNKDSPWRWYR